MSFGTFKVRIVKKIWNFLQLNEPMKRSLGQKFLLSFS
jgi:hypothetical protein